MTPEQKQRAVELLAAWRATTYALHADSMAAMLQEIVNSPEPEPVARVTGYYGGYLSIATVDGRVLPAGTALYAAPPHQSEHHLEMVNTPAPSVPEPLTDSFVQTVPDKCDRIVWRGSYYHLNASHIQPEPPAPSVPDAKLVQTMVNHFLCWKLPKDFGPDAGISFKPAMPYETPGGWPVGTNLFTADQAKAMIEHMLDGVTIAAPTPAEAPADVVRDSVASEPVGYLYTNLQSGEYHVSDADDDYRGPERVLWCIEPVYRSARKANHDQMETCAG